MNDNQKICFDIAYKLFHDEAVQCTNLSALIEMNFPKDDEVLNKTMRELIATWLDTRAKLGAKIMDILYALKTERDQEYIKPKLARRVKNEDM